MTKKVLLVGSSFSAAPLFFSLKRRGFHVSVCGNCVSDPCHQYADKSFPVDYSKREELLALVEEGGFDYLVPTCNDYSYMSCAWVAERIGFSGFDPYKIANILHSKNAFRDLLESHALPGPRFSRQQAGESGATAGLRYPLLVKPVDSFSGRGVTKLVEAAGLSEALAAARQASRSGESVVEEFVDGRLYSHSAFIRKQEIVADFFVDEYCTLYPYQVNCSNHPSSLPANHRDSVREAVGRLIRLLGLKDGLLHTQFIADADDFWIIECMRRCPGDLYGHLIELSAGIDYADLFVLPFIDESLPTSLPLLEARPFGRHTISTSRALVSYSFSCRLPEADVRIVPLKASGEALDVAPFDKLAVLFAEYADKAAMFELTPTLAERVNIYPHAKPCLMTDGSFS